VQFIPFTQIIRGGRIHAQGDHPQAAEFRPSMSLPACRSWARRWPTGSAICSSYTDRKSSSSFHQAPRDNVETLIVGENLWFEPF
jgi:hypothetical protein